MDSMSSPPVSLTMLESPPRASDVKYEAPRPYSIQQLYTQQNQPSQRSFGATQDDLVMSDLEPEFYHAAALFSPQAARRQEQFRVLGTLGLTGLAFFVSCGGPIGSEPLASAGGPLVGLIAVSVYAVCCLFPFMYVVTELCTTFPENGGYTVWIMTIFGPFWGFQAGYWSWVSCALNNAIYPGLLYSTMSDALGWKVSAVAEYCIKASIAVLLCLPSLFSVRFVAAAAFVLLVVISALFALFSTWGFASGTPEWSALLDVRDAGTVASLRRAEVNASYPEEAYNPQVDWGLLVNTLFWNFDGLNDASIIGGEVRNPTRAYPRIFIANVLIALALYVVPLISAVTATSGTLSWVHFDEDSYPTIARVIGGSTLHTLMVVSSMFSLIGLFTSSIMLQSFQVLGMAHMRLLPAAFRTRHTTFQTPQYAVLLGLLTTMVLLLFDYESILNLTNAFSAGNQVLIVLTMLQLRRVLPHITRPTKVPGPFPLLCAVLVPVVVVFLYIVVTTLLDAMQALALCGLAVPGVIYGLVQRQRVRHELQQRALQRQQNPLAQLILPPCVVP